MSYKPAGDLTDDELELERAAFFQSPDYAIDPVRAKRHREIEEEVDRRCAISAYEAWENSR